MKTKKKLFAILVILAMMATLVPIMTFADSSDKTADFSTNPQEAITLLGGDAKATWQSNTLTSMALILIQLRLRH